MINQLWVINNIYIYINKCLNKNEKKLQFFFLNMDYNIKNIIKFTIRLFFL